MGLFLAEVHEDGRHRLVAEAPGRDEPLVAADHDVVIVPGDDGLQEAELAHRAGEAVQLLGADLARIGGVGVQVVDRNLDDLRLGYCWWHSPSWSPSEGMKKDARPRAKRPHSDGFTQL